MRSFPARRGMSRGFTLLELLIALAILIIIMGVVGNSVDRTSVV